MLADPVADYQPAQRCRRRRYGIVSKKTDPRLMRRRLESNVRFLRPYDEVVAMWRRCIAYANDPERLFARFHHQVDSTYVNRMIPPAKGKLNWANVLAGLVLAFACSGTSASSRTIASRSGGRRAMR